MKYHIVQKPAYPSEWLIMDEAEEWVFDVFDTQAEAERVAAEWEAEEDDAQQEGEWFYQDDGR